MSPLFSFRACGINPREGACAYQSIHISRVQIIQFESTVAIVPMPFVEHAAAESSPQPRTYISPQVSRASKPLPLTSPTSLPLQTNAEYLCLALEQSYSPLEGSMGAEMAIMSLSRMSCMWPAGCAMFSPVYTSRKPPVFEHT